MKIPEKAPDWVKIVKSRSKTIIEIGTGKEASKLVKKANCHYLYWDKFKYQSLPNGIEHDELWAYLKFVRDCSKILTPAVDKEGCYFWYWLPDTILKDINLITARTDMLELEKLGLLIKRKMGHEFYFYPAPDLPEKVRTFFV